MPWFGDSAAAHRKRGHHPHPRYKVVTEGGRKVQKITRWVCDCGATLRR